MAQGGLAAIIAVWLARAEQGDVRSMIDEMTEAAGGRRPSGWAIFREALRRQYLWTDAEGRRHVGWRVWFFVWLVPGLFALAAIGLAVPPLIQDARWQTAEATVRQVYAWEGTTPFDRGVMQYSPVLCYIWTDGAETCATPGQRHRDWNFEVGSRHEILFDPRTKRDVRLPGFANLWALPAAIGLIALGTGLVALYGHVRLRRWQRGGAGPA